MKQIKFKHRHKIDKKHKHVIKLLKLLEENIEKKQMKKAINTIKIFKMKNSKKLIKKP